MASQGRFERPITRERLRELLSDAVSLQGAGRRRQPRTLPKSSSGGERIEATARTRP